MKVYKLTDENARTHGDTQWGPGISHEAKPGDGELCSEYWIHAYEDPLLAVLHNPLHIAFSKPRLWEAEAEGEIKREGRLKLGCKKLTVLNEIPLPELTVEQRVAYGIYAALEVYKDEKFVEWAEKWLKGEDRSAEAAAEAEREALEAQRKAVEMAERAAEAAEAAEMVERAVEAIEEVEGVKEFAALVAKRVAKREEQINLLDCAKKAVQVS